MSLPDELNLGAVLGGIAFGCWQSSWGAGIWMWAALEIAAALSRGGQQP